MDIVQSKLLTSQRRGATILSDRTTKFARVLSSLELFAGGGGMALGLHMAGFAHKQLVEWDDRACQTLERNGSDLGSPWTPESVIRDDVRMYTARRDALHEVDLVAGGPPCQPFSLGGVHAGQADSRNMFPAALDVVRSCRPKLVIFENVPGLLRPSFAPYMNYVAEQLTAPSITPRPDEHWVDHERRLRKSRLQSELRYQVHSQLISSADLGVPQQRKRLFLIAVREDISLDWEEVVTDHSEDALLYDQFVSGSYWEEHATASDIRSPDEAMVTLAARYSRRIARLRTDGRPNAKRWRTVRDMLREPEPLPDPVDGIQRGPWPNHVGVPGARAYPGHTGSDIDRPAKTIKAGVHGVCGGEAMIRFGDGSLRYMTTREAARTQGFPDRYEFVGARSHAMRLVGNAVAVPVAQAIGEHVRRLTRI